MTNPYQSPAAFDPKQFQELPDYAVASAQDYGWVNQIRIFAILNAVQGMLEIPMGLMTMSFAFILPAFLRMQQANPAFPKGEEPPQEFFWFMSVMYVVMGLPVFVGGVLRIVAGIRNYNFRGRTLGLVSMIVGMSSLLSCYCAPTAIAILVYGLIVYLNPAVKLAFAMGAQGQPADKILAAFVPYRPAPQPGSG